MIFSEVEKLYDQSSILREACVKRPTRGSDTCYLKFKSVAGKTPSYIEGLPLGDGCLSNRFGYLTYDDGFGKIADAHKETTEENHYIDRDKTIWSNGKFRSSDRSLCNGKKKTIKIKTNKGFENEGTPNHRFKVVRNGEVTWSRFDEMAVGDKVLMDRSYRWHNGVNDVTKDQAYALGFMIGDGCWTDRHRSLGVATMDKELLPILQSGIVGCDYFYENTDDVHFVASSSKKVMTQNSVRLGWLDFWDMPVSYAINKKLPKKILSSSRECMSSCISGLYDSDGHIQVATAKGGIGITIGFTNTSEELIDQLHYILLHYGIVACKTTRDRNPKWNIVHELLITGSDVKIFYDEIGFRLKRKQDILEAAVKNKTTWLRKDFVPGVRDEMIRISENNRIKKGNGTTESRYCKAFTLKKKAEINQYIAECFIKTYEYLDDPFIDKLKEMANPDIYYDEIVELSEGESVTYDMHVPDGNEYCVNGFFSHNSKIRGSRFYLVLVDELAQVPDQVLDMVVRPMGATSLAPMERVRRIEEKDRLIKAGLATEADFKEEKVNKMVMTSSGYYKFNHMWRRMQDHWKMMNEAEAKGEECPYAVWQVPYWDLPNGFLDKNNIAEAKRIMSSHEYSMEYEAAMISDSEGFFKASMLEECTVNSDFTIKHRGEPERNYIVGMDPNQGGKASCGVVIIEMGRPNKVVNVLELKNHTTQGLTKAVQDICNQYNVLRIFMDRGGGGKAVCDLLEEGYNNQEPMIDRTNPDHDHLEGRHILEMVNFNPGWISDANFTAKAMLEDKSILFPAIPTDTTSDIVAKAYKVVEILKSQMLSIVVTQTTTGVLHFDTPSKSMNKDLYSGFILAAHGVRMVDKEFEVEEEPALYSASGLVRGRNTGASFDYIGATGNIGFGSPSAVKVGLSAAVLSRKKK